MRIACTASGTADTALVFVHGGLADRSFWDGQHAAFAARFHVIALDLAGHGESGQNRREWGIPQFGRDVAATAVRTSATASFQWTSPTKRVVLVAPDVELGELDAGGTVTPRADWTKAAQGFIARDIAAYLGAKGTELVDVEELTNPHDVQLSKLHGAVGNAIRTHLYAFKLPNKGNALDWTLGPGTSDMRDRYGADYALFVYVRDSYTTTGRAAVMILGAIAGVGLQGGSQYGFASLVDLRTSNIVWFNQIANTIGDLRTEEPAQKAVDGLIKDLPI